MLEEGLGRFDELVGDAMGAQELHGEAALLGDALGVRPPPARGTAMGGDLRTRPFPDAAGEAGVVEVVMRDETSSMSSSA